MKHIDKWTTRQLAAQCIMPRISADEFFSDEKYRLKIFKLVEEGVGGFCVFAGNMNNTAKMTNELQGRSEIPIIFAADYEHGLSMRLSDGTAFPHAMAIGKSGAKISIAGK